MKKLTITILEKALEDWSAPEGFQNNTFAGFCHYFYKEYSISYYGTNFVDCPWCKYSDLEAKDLLGKPQFHFSEKGSHVKGRLVRIFAIKGMIADLKTK